MNSSYSDLSFVFQLTFKNLQYTKHPLIHLRHVICALDGLKLIPFLNFYALRRSYVMWRLRYETLTLWNSYVTICAATVSGFTLSFCRSTMDLLHRSQHPFTQIILYIQYFSPEFSISPYHFASIIQYTERSIYVLHIKQ